MFKILTQFTLFQITDLENLTSLYFAYLYKNYEVQIPLDETTVVIKKNVKPSNQISSSKGRYIYILSQAQTLASLGSKNAANFDKVVNTFEKLQSEMFSQNKDNINDDKCTHPGRKKKKRIK